MRLFEEPRLERIHIHVPPEHRAAVERLAEASGAKKALVWRTVVREGLKALHLMQETSK